MEYLNKILKSPQPVKALVDLVETSAPESELEESDISEYFTNYDMALTIVLKGSKAPKTERLRGDIYSQFQHISDILKTHVFDNCVNHVTYFELHKCGEWLHSHSIIKLKKDGTKTANANRIRNIKKNIFESITLRKLQKGEQYRHRVCLEKLHTVSTWFNYIKKDEKIMRVYDARIHKLFKLQRTNPNSTTVSF